MAQLSPFSPGDSVTGTLLGWVGVCVGRGLLIVAFRSLELGGGDSRSFVWLLAEIEKYMPVQHQGYVKNFLILIAANWQRRAVVKVKL